MTAPKARVDPESQNRGWTPAFKARLPGISVRMSAEGFSGGHAEDRCGGAQGMKTAGR
jgi:hypothetical protein